RPNAGRAYQDREDASDAPHGPVGTWLGSQLIVPPSVNGVEPSPGSRSSEPGQRLWLPMSREGTPMPLMTSPASSGSSRSMSPDADGVNALNVVSTRPSAPLASVTPDFEKSSNHPTSSGV